jgi:archaellum component FlaC
MAGDSFSQKEILIQLMGKVDTIGATLGKQELMLNTIHEASASRDEKIKDLKEQVINLEVKVEDLSAHVEALKSFNKVVLFAWGALVFLISTFGRDIFNKLF